MDDYNYFPMLRINLIMFMLKACSLKTINFYLSKLPFYYDVDFI